jgi:hypothetical protein
LRRTLAELQGLVAQIHQLREPRWHRVATVVVPVAGVLMLFYSVAIDKLANPGIATAGVGCVMFGQLTPKRWR